MKGPGLAGLPFVPGAGHESPQLLGARNVLRSSPGRWRALKEMGNFTPNAVEIISWLCSPRMHSYLYFSINSNSGDLVNKGSARRIPPEASQMESPTEFHFEVFCVI